MDTTTKEVDLFLQLEKLKSIYSLNDAYMLFKEKASNTIAHILENDSELKNELFELATDHSRASYRNNIKITEKKHELPERLLEVCHCQFTIFGNGLFGNHTTMGIGKLYLTINLNNYLKGNKDIVYISFLYSDDGQDGNFLEELNEEQHLELKIPEIVLYRYLPLLSGLGEKESAEMVLRNLLERKSSFSECEIVDGKTSQTICFL